jgi:hypothetical protein
MTNALIIPINMEALVRVIINSPKTMPYYFGFFLLFSDVSM